MDGVENILVLLTFWAGIIVLLKSDRGLKLKRTKETIRRLFSEGFYRSTV